MRHRPFVGDRDIDARRIALGRDRLQAALRPSGQFHGRPAARQIHHTHIAPPHPAAQPGSERFGASLLGREPFRIGLDPVAPLVGPRSFDGREDAIEKAVAVPLDDFGNPARIGDIVDLMGSNQEPECRLFAFGRIDPAR